MRHYSSAGWLTAVRLAASALALAPMVGGVSPATARPVQILALGDSLTAGFGLPDSESFPARLEARLRAEGLDVHVIDAGRSGDTTAGGLARLDRFLAAKPDVVIVELGANDVLSGIDPKIVRTNLDAILTKAQANGAKVLLAGMHALANRGADYQREFEHVYPDLAQVHGAMLYPFFLSGVGGEPTLNQWDGLHPNARGVEVIVEHITPFVVRVIRGI